MHHFSGLEQMNQIEKEKLKPLSCRHVYKSSVELTSTTYVSMSPYAKETSRVLPEKLGP